LQDLMRQADTALYEHKRKNRSCVSNDLTAANSEASARAGGAKRPAFGESTAAGVKWPLSVDGATRT